MSRNEDLQRIERCLARISRIGAGREAARIRAERSGIHLSRPAIKILSALRVSGPVRLSKLAQLTDLEAPLISREVRSLVEAGLARRQPDPTDGRAGIVELTAKGHKLSEQYRASTAEIIAETFSEWTAADLRTLAGYLERVEADVVRPA